MDFLNAIKHMSSGAGVSRPKWLGYLFIDVDDRIKHAGEKTRDEEFWHIDTNRDDWEIRMESVSDKNEITEARMESLMDSNSAQIKRLYFLEEIIESQHKAFKKIADSVTAEMDETRKSLAMTVKHIPVVREKIAELSFMPQEYARLAKSIDKLRKQIENFSKSQKFKEKKAGNDKNSLVEAEKKELEQVKKNLKAKGLAKVKMESKQGK